MRARYSWPLLGALLALFAAVPVWAQTAYEPAFDAEVVVSRDDDGVARLDVYADVPYQNLRFLARTAGFEASYVVTAEVQRLAADGTVAGLVASRTWSRDVTVASYDETLSDASDRTVQAVDVEPGTYVVELTIEDGASGRVFAHELGANVRAMDGAIAMSDPVLLDAYDEATGRFEPNVSGAVSTEQESFTNLLRAFRSGGVRVSGHVRHHRPHEAPRPPVV